MEIYQTSYRANDVFTVYLEMSSPSRLTPAQVDLLRRESSGDPESVENIQIENGQPFIHEFPMRQNYVYFVKLTPMAGK